MSKHEARLIMAYAKNSMNVSKASRALNYHRNTFIYHFDKIREKTGLDPRNFFDLVELYSIAIEASEGSNE